MFHYLDRIWGGGVIQLINNRNACKLDLLSIRIRGFEAIHGRHLSFTFAYTLVTFILFGSFWFVRSFTFHSSPRFLLHRTHTHTHALAENMRARPCEFSRFANFPYVSSKNIIAFVQITQFKL